MSRYGEEVVMAIPPGIVETPIGVSYVIIKVRARGKAGENDYVEITDSNKVLLKVGASVLLHQHSCGEWLSLLKKILTSSIKPIKVNSTADLIIELQGVYVHDPRNS